MDDQAHFDEDESLLLEGPFVALPVLMTLVEYLLELEEEDTDGRAGVCVSQERM